MNLFTVLSATETSGNAAGGMMMLVFYVLIFGIMIYFLMIKPQKKQSQRQEEMMKSLKPGVSIMTTSGFFGTVIDIPDDETVIVEFGNNKNCRIPMHKRAIAEIEDPESAVDNGSSSDDSSKEETKEEKKSKK